ncbi:MAG: hypothetical protein WD751_00155 [Anaerolineales bacterium]
MSVYKDSIDTLRLAVEGLQHSKARYKDKAFVRQLQDGDLVWEGDVFSFELMYDSKHSGATKEEIAGWRLPGPTPEALAAAEQRGLKIRKLFETAHARNPEIRRRAKLAYAWSSPIKGSAKRKLHVVAHEGAVKSPADAVKAVYVKGNSKGK